MPLFVVLLGTAYKRDARRDLFESAPVCVVLLGTAQKRDARRDLFESVPVCRSPQHKICLRVFLFVVLLGTAHERDAGNYLVCRFLRHRPRERRRERELSYLSFSSTPPTRETQRAMRKDVRETVLLRRFLWHDLQERRREEWEEIGAKLFPFGVFVGIARERDVLEIFPVCHRTRPRPWKSCRKRRGEFFV